MQLQEDLKKQLSAEGNYTEEELEEYMQNHKKVMIDSLWKLNVADIEATLSRVCQMVCFLDCLYYFEMLLFACLVISFTNCANFDFRCFKITMLGERNSVLEPKV